ncbi:MAG: type I DNA topoisomerase, partial [Acidimicrobiales bacterium]
MGKRLRPSERQRAGRRWGARRSRASGAQPPRQLARVAGWVARSVRLAGRTTRVDTDRLWPLGLENVAQSLVIVESPAKARTISQFLGKDFVVKASMGHVRDLEAKGLAVDVDNHFKPTYVVHTTKKDVIKDLRAQLKDAEALYLATDEDREGEAISWHLLEVLQPRVPVRRMVFHEITRHAIDDALRSPRDLDYGLVDAQETRRIVDRLFGYPVSEVLWKKVARNLSAGRVQSVATRLVVERERERMRFVTAGYWDIEASHPTEPAFSSTLVEVDAARIATGRDFDDAGQLQEAAGPAPRLLREADARGLVDRLVDAAFIVRSVEEKPYTSKPKAPFMTSTLQQEGGRKLRMTAQQVMRVAQGLYERGYITYMRTDSIALSEQALTTARDQVRELYGDAYLPAQPRRYASKVKNAQEAHEAIRPAGETWRTPDRLSGELTGADLRVYELVWKRTMASQMADARGQTVSVRIGATSSTGEDAVFAASGRTITFPGYLRAYVEGADDPDAELEDRETVLPALIVGDAVPLAGLEPKGHATTPPPRYTEASL